MPDDTCCVQECTRPVKVKSRELCGMHDMRRRRHGDVQPDHPCRDDRREDGQLWCSRCETYKEPDGFYRNRATKTGFDGVCIACTIRRRTESRVARAVARKAWIDQPGVRDRIKANKRRYYRSIDKERANEIKRAWRKNNPERLRHQIRAQNAARYARIKNAPGKSTAVQGAARWDYYGGRCWMCGAPATDTDHVKPLAGGGSNWPANLRPSCSTCNRSKSDAWPYEPDPLARALSEADRFDRPVAA
jgi:5-methylcytosine-specific restriction endonuclease McrA